ncbi:MAG: hypothetical protein AAB606_00545 [Patescibacteria group bacterium]
MDPQSGQNQIDPETQKRLNQPLVNPNGLSPEDQAFLSLVMSKVDKGEINLLSPSTLLNQAVYDALPEEQQGKVDYDAVNLATTLRNIYDLWKLEQKPTFQIENLVRQVRLTKERLEQISGDVYVI